MNPTPIPRIDLYAGIHKALRLAMAETLVRFGSLDTTEPGAHLPAIAQLRTLLDLCRAHVEKEEQIVHPAIEARSAGRSLRIATEHVEHLAAIDTLEADAVALQCAPSPQAAHRLYRKLALFVADNLEHMECEEAQHNAVLWAEYDDTELLGLHNTIVASIEPVAMAQVLHWMLPALNPVERFELLAAMRDTAPAPAYSGALAIARSRLAAPDCSRLELALQAPALAA
jgi:hypothetical protein